MSPDDLDAMGGADFTYQISYSQPHLAYQNRPTVLSAPHQVVLKVKERMGAMAV